MKGPTYPHGVIHGTTKRETRACAGTVITNRCCIILSAVSCCARPVLPHVALLNCDHEL